MNARARTVLLIIFILGAFSVAILAIMKIQNEEQVKIISDKYYENVKVFYESVAGKYEDYYDDIILNLFNDLRLKRAIQDGDKNKVYQYALNKYTVLRKENLHLLNMKFFTAEDTLLLDMNDRRAEYKANVFVKEVNKKHKSLFSAYDNKTELVYKSIHPIFYGSKYLGCVELDISAKYILDDMKKFANIDGFMFRTSTSGLYYNTMNNMLLLSVIPKNISHQGLVDLETRKGATYATYTFLINNKMSINVAKLYFFNDTTVQTAKFKGDLEQIIIFLAAMVLLTVIIVAFSIGKSLKSMQITYDNLYEYTDMIDNNIMMVDTDENGLITGASRRFCDVSGYMQDELVGKSFEALKESSVDKKVYEEISTTLKKDSEWSGDLHNLDKDGNSYWLSVKAQKKTIEKKFACYNYILHNITDKKTSEELVFIDELTSLYNRKYFNDVFPRMVNGTKRNGGCVNFVVLDVDGFSMYNESYGAVDGDSALIKIADKLQGSLRRPDDYSFRLGGGEFAVLFRSASEEEGYMYTQVLRKNIEMLGIKNETNHKFGVLTASFGLASFIFERIIDEKDVYKTAYTHLRRAKEDGKNKVVYNLV